MKPLLIAASVSLITALPAYASPCDALAGFFVKAVEASGAKADKATLAEQAATFRRDEKACVRAAARMADTRAYSADIGKPISLLQKYLVPEATFAVQVIGSGRQIEAIEFDIDAVGALRKRPAR